MERAERARLRVGVRGAGGRSPAASWCDPGLTRARLLAENLGDYAPSEVVAPRSDGVARTAKYQAALDGGHDVLVLISGERIGRSLFFSKPPTATH